MRIRNRHLLIVLTLSFSLFQIFSLGGALASDVVYFSMVPKKNFDQQIQELSPLLTLLEKRLKKNIRIVRPQSYNAVIEGILSKTIDVAVLGPAAYAKTRVRDNRVDAFASFARKKGFITPEGSYYYSVLFTLKENGFKSVDDLARTKVALTDPESTSGSVMPNMFFSKHIGKSMKDFFGTIVFTGSHDRSIKSVLRGYVDVAFVSSARIDEAVNKAILKPDQVNILWKSKPIHHDPFVFSSGVDDALKNQVKQIMFSGDPSLEPMLVNMHMAGIVPVSDDDYQAIHEIVSMQNLKK